MISGTVTFLLIWLSPFNSGTGSARQGGRGAGSASQGGRSSGGTGCRRGRSFGETGERPTAPHAVPPGAGSADQHGRSSGQSGSFSATFSCDPDAGPSEGGASGDHSTLIPAGGPTAPPLPLFRKGGWSGRY